jgi:hypothetical protein
MVFRDDANGDPINFWPGVCGAEGDDETWNSLVAAIADGAICRGQAVTHSVRGMNIFASLRACLVLAGRAGMSQHRLQQGKPRGLDRSHVGLGTSAESKR